MEIERAKKQNYLRIEIIEKGFDQSIFETYCNKLNPNCIKLFSFNLNKNI